MTLSPFIAKQVEQRPIEAKILRKIIRALKDAGDPIVEIWDGEEDTSVRTEEDIFEVVFNLDECRLYTKEGGWVYFICGEQWDVMCDYTLSLEAALEPVSDYIQKNMV